MQRSYVAYGMELRCSFTLRGMAARTARQLPSLRVELRTPAELASAWRAEAASAAWTGRLSDGVRLTVQRGDAGDVLFSYGERARFRLDASQRLLECAPADRDASWQRALIGNVLCKVSVMRGYEALHAAVVDSPQGVLAFIAPSGAGKSTLALEFVRRGWPLFADDALVLASGALGVLAYPGTPHIGVAGHPPRMPSADDLDSTPAATDKRWLAVRTTSDRPRPIRMLCLLARGSGLALHAEALARNPLRLAPYMLGFRGDAERQRRRFELYGDLMAAAPLVRLTGDLADRPAALASVVERALELAPALAGSAA